MICNVCPRMCGAERDEYYGSGVCGMGLNPVVARAAPHMWEEPVISGSKGSGTIFFSGCNLHCSYCQNYKISGGSGGEPLSAEQLRKLYFKLIALGVHNINLVTPTHFTDVIIRSLYGGLPVPVIWNCGGYERVETLRRLEGLVDIYMPDWKYSDPELAARYSSAPDYPEVVEAAVREMYRQTGPFRMGEDGLLKGGTIIRHLILPGCLDNSFGVIDRVSELFSPGQVLFSLMSQFTPVENVPPELNRAITHYEHNAANEHMADSGIEDGFCQELGSASESFIPEFDGTGL